MVVVGMGVGVGVAVDFPSEGYALLELGEVAVVFHLVFVVFVFTLNVVIVYVYAQESP